MSIKNLRLYLLKAFQTAYSDEESKDAFNMLLLWLVEDESRDFCINKLLTGVWECYIYGEGIGATGCNENPIQAVKNALLAFNILKSERQEHGLSTPT